MAHHRPTSPSRAARLVAGLAILLGLAALASAAPAPHAITDAPPPAVVALESSSTATPLHGTFGYTADIRLNEPVSYLQVRFQLHSGKDKLLFQRTQVSDSPSPGEHNFSFSRDLQGLGLNPGAYPVTVSITGSTVKGSDIATEVAAELLIYDPSRAPTPVTLVARIVGYPAAGAGGRLLLDPATSTAARDAVMRVSELVIADPAAKITLAVPPYLLEEWRRYAGGYTLADGTAVSTTDPRAVDYALALQGLKQAIATGRLELTSQGYSDADLDDLAASHLASDTGPQYDAGFSACFTSLEVTPSAGTVPAGGCAPPAALGLLVDRGIKYVVVSPGCTRLGKKPAPSGAYRASGVPLTAIVEDAAAGRALAAGRPAPVLRRVFDRQAGPKTKQPVTIALELGEGASDATSTLVAAVAELSQPWIRLQLASEARPASSAQPIVLEAGSPTPGAPATFWPTVRAGRANARALLAALGSSDPDANAAQTASLVSEGSVWSRPDATWVRAPDGAAFAEAARAAGSAIFDSIHLRLTQVTFAGGRGKLPVTITNGTQKTLRVVVHSRAYGGVRIIGPRSIRVTLRPKENFVEIPVDMQSSLRGSVAVDVRSADLIIERKAVIVRRSYLDRLAIIGGVLLALVVLLAFIIRRVATTGAAEPNGSGPEPDDAPESRDGCAITGTPDDADGQGGTNAPERYTG